MNTYDQYEIIRKAYGITNQAGTKVSERLINSKEEFIEFLRSGVNKNDNGGILVISGKQYIFAKNDNDGMQGHITSFAKAYLEMEDKYSDISFVEACRISSYRENNYLNFSIESEKGVNTPLYLCLRTVIKRKISREEYESFKAFVDKYAEIFRKLPFGYYFYVKSIDNTAPIDSIDEALQYLSTLVDDKMTTYEYEKGEKIIGVPTNIEEKGKIL